VRVISILLVESEKVYPRVRENDFVGIANVEAEVTTGNTDSTAGGNQPKMVAEEVHQSASCKIGSAA